MANTNEVAKGLTDLVRQGQFDEAVAAYYSPNIVSTEPIGDPATVHGLEAVIAKSKYWVETFEVHGLEVDGPFVHGDQFMTEYKLDATNRQSGERSTMHEVALYTVANGKIVDEKFFFKG